MSRLAGLLRLRPVGLLVVLAGFCIWGLTAHAQGVGALNLSKIEHPSLETAEPLVRQQLGEARRIFESQLVEADSAVQRATVLGELGMLYHAYDLTEAATTCYQNATTLAGDEIRWHHLSGVLKRDNGDFEGARQSFEEVLRLRRDYLPAVLYAGALALDLGDSEQAEEYGRQALQIDASNASVHELAGRLAAARGDARGAIAAYRRALELQPAASRLYYRLAMAERKAGDIEAARRSLENNGPVEVVIVDPIVAALRGKARGSAALMQRGANAKAAGLMEAAIEDYQKAVVSDPRSPEARRDLGAVLAQVKRYRESAEQYREAVRLEPDKALNHFVLGLVLESAGERETGTLAIAQAVELAPEYREFRLALAARLATAGRLAEASTHFDRLISQDPRDRAARVERAKLRLASGEAPGALADAQSVIAEPERDSMSAEAMSLAGSVLGMSGDLAAGIEMLTAALELEPELVSGHFTLGNLYGAAGDFDRAVSHYRRVTELEPERVAAWLGEVTALSLAGKEAESIGRLKKSQEEVSDPRLTFALARLLVTAQDLSVRDPGRAVGLADQLMREQPSPEYGELLVLALARSGRLSDAASVQAELLQALPDGAGEELRATWSRRLEELTAAAANAAEVPKP